MSKLVLNVGQCNPDHAAIVRFLTSQFDVVVDRTDQLDDTLDALQRKSYDLVLINRKLDIDYTDGSAILDAIKSNEELRHTPVMIVSNYPDAQAAAVSRGAAPGFGKAELSDPATVDKVSAVLGTEAKRSIGQAR